MKIIDFANYLQKLENTSKRLEMISIISNFIKEVDPQEIDIAIYMALGYLKNPFNNPKFNIADKMMIKILSQTLNKDSKDILDNYETTGDLGTTFFELSKTINSDLTLKQVHFDLLSIAQTQGIGSQDLKILKTSKLLNSVNKLSGKFLIRIILSTTRLGFTELTIIDALSVYLNNKSFKPLIEQKYNEHPDIGLIAKNIVQKGIKGLDEISIKPGVPIQLQKAQRVKSFEEVLNKMDTTWLEYKLDGTRVQLHLDKNNKYETKDSSLFKNKDDEYLVKTYTRNLEETTNMYPDLILSAKKNLAVNSVILDGEAVGYDPKTKTLLPFQVMMQRKRKHKIEEIVNEIPLKYFVFDILYLNNQSLMNLPLIKRRKILDKVIIDNNIIKISDHLQTDDIKKVYKYFEQAKTNGLEGLIAKNPNDIYQAGARSFSWIKLKVADEKLLLDSVDCVILGYYFGKGVRAKFGIGGLLLGVYDSNDDNYKTVSKLGTGLTDEDLKYIKDLCDKFKIKQQNSNTFISKMFTPDVFVEPKIILEVGADEITKSPSHSAKYALRFPRLIKVRLDKGPKQATNLIEIEQMYVNK